MEYEIIAVKPGEDLGEVIKLRQEIFYESEDELDEMGISLLMTEQGKSVAIGRILLDMESDRLIIDQIGVTEGIRRQGIGERMLDELIKIARESQAEEVWAKPKKNEAIIAMLKKHGFDELNPYWMSVDMPYYR